MTGPRLSIIPARAATDRALKPRDLQVLCVLGRHTDDLGWCRKSQVKMAEEMGCARSTVFDAVERLVAAGYLERYVQEEDNGRDSPHVYRVVLDPKHPCPGAVRDADCTVANPQRPGGTPADRSAPPADISAPPAGPEPAPPAGPGPAPKNDLLGTTHQNEEERERAPGEFERFWSQYPHKVGKRDAARAFDKARSRAPFAAIMAGLARYAAKTDDRPWCNPSTFLNQDRWADQPAPPVPQRGRGPPRQENFADFMNRNFGQGVNRHDHHRDDHTGPTIDASVRQTDRGGGDEDLQRLPVFRLE
jgi:hypothetical protein